MLDNVLQDFIDHAPPSMDAARYSAMRERSVGLGAMGFHSFLQTKGIPFESALARAANLRMFKHLRREADAASRRAGRRARRLPGRRRARRDGALLAQAGDRAHRQHLGDLRRHQRLHRADPGQHLHAQDAVRLVQRAQPGAGQTAGQPRARTPRTPGNPSSRTKARCSTSTASPTTRRSVFRTAFEIDQRWVVELAADRAPLICQGQSLNLYLRSDIHKWDLLMLHWTAWERGVKSLYYCRSKSVQRAGFAGVEADNTRAWPARSRSLRTRTNTTNAWPASRNKIMSTILESADRTTRHARPAHARRAATSRFAIPGPSNSGAASSRSTGCPRRSRWARTARTGTRASPTPSATC